MSLGFHLYRVPDPDGRAVACEHPCAIFRLVDGAIYMTNVAAPTDGDSWIRLDAVTSAVLDEHYPGLARAVRRALVAPAMDMLALAG